MDAAADFFTTLLNAPTGKKGQICGYSGVARIFLWDESMGLIE
ncbi:hypothetical protein SK3146_05168 [Paenibacillus konkukensis]|uniref:Uncharacterized protein n=1 Tax=Paenibacillus konkukensis TaxID=2020716 RepID=A0ABY4RUI7_9BACL|nr:hypothetical protein SK3146_05168 [Paenibacillus konkukensis]